MKRKIALSLLVLFLTVVSYSQKIKVQSGTFEFLKDQKEINVQFNYDGMTFYKDKKSEKEYVEGKEKDLIEKKGKEEADKWITDWSYSKNTSFPDKFLASINKYEEKIKIQYSQNKSNAKYTLIVKTVWIYPGWFGGVMKQPSKVSTVLNFVETANTSNILLSISCDNALGDVYMVGVPNTNDRIAEGYAKTGKEIARFLDGKIK